MKKRERRVFGRKQGAREVAVVVVVVLLLLLLTVGDQGHPATQRMGSLTAWPCSTNGPCQPRPRQPQPQSLRAASTSSALQCRQQR